MKRILCFLPILIFTISFTQDLDKLMEKATGYYFDEKYDFAFDYSKKALEISPFHPYANFYIAEYYGFEGEFTTALEYYDKAIKYHIHEEFALAYYQRAITKIVLHQDLSYCGDINILKRVFTKDDEYQYLEKEHPAVFGLCDFFPSSTQILISAAKILAQQGSCMYSKLLYNEASKSGAEKELAEYDNSLCN